VVAWLLEPGDASFMSMLPAVAGCRVLRARVEPFEAVIEDSPSVCSP